MKFPKLIGVTLAMIAIAISHCYSQTFIGQSNYGYNGEGLSPTGTMFNGINDFCRDTAGNYYVVDGGFRIRKVDMAANVVHTIAGTGVTGTTGDGGPAPLAKITNKNYGICADRLGNVYFVDSNRIRKISTISGIINTVAGGGTSIADGIAGTSARLTNPISLCADTNNNIYFCDSNAVRKIDGVTGIITTVAGSMSAVGFSGDGGPAAMALLHLPVGVTIDSRRGDLYIFDHSNFRIRKVDAAGIITTYAGNGKDAYNGDGSLATSCALSFATQYYLRPYPLFMSVDTAGDLYVKCISHEPDGWYFYGNSRVVIRKIIRSTGIMTKVKGSISIYDMDPMEYNTIFFIDTDQTIVESFNSQISRKQQDQVYIGNMTLSDTMLTDTCHTPALVSFSLHGIVYGTPTPGDSVSLRIAYGDDTVKNIKLPYYTTTDPITGATVFGFGDLGGALDHIYQLPGKYHPYILIKQGNGRSDIAVYDTIFVRNSCNAYLSEILASDVTDSVLSGPCVTPALIRTDITGSFITRGGLAGPNDSVYLVLPNFDSPAAIVKVPLTFYTSYDDYMDIYDSLGAYVETITYTAEAYYTYKYTWYHFAPSALYDLWYEGSGGYSTIPTGRINDLSTNGFFSGQYYVDDCSTSHLFLATADAPPATSSLCPHAVPYSTNINAWLTFRGAAASMTSVPLVFHFGDGTDTTVYVTPQSPIYNGHYTASLSFPHTYIDEGSYVPTITTPIGFDSVIRWYDTLNLYNSCSPVNGVLYLDANHNCTADAGEVMLEYWPFIIVNNTTGDTTNAWTDGTGHYHITLADANTYTLIPMHNEYGASSTDSFVVACPVAGHYTLTASAGVSFTQDFGINIYHPADPAPDSVDMRVAGWGWGFIPGDTGVISVWSSNEWGYTGDTLSSNITLTLDSHLTYLGMWNGPAPTSVVGNVLTWHFSTSGSLFDITASVKVSCVTTATMGDTIHNTLYVAPTTLTDPDLLNNTYSWSEPVRTSWDPNEKEVSPKGFGTEGYIANGTPMSYIVHFQNTGTARARHIKVVDTLSSDLDLSTLQVVNSTAPVLLFQTADHVIQFKFNDINLPDSADDPEGSKGFVAFNILPKENLAAGTQIQNTANIYFDYNPAVVTNTTLNTIEDSTRMITGISSVCVDGTITLSNGLAGGVWSATNGNATVSASGVVSAIHAGADTIVYTMYGDKRVYKVINIIGAPDPGVITGSNIVCEAGTTTLTNAVAGGIWSSSTGAATVTGGIVSGITVGTSIISYSVIGTCGTATDTMLISVNTIPVTASLSGSNTVCATAAITLTADISGGTWNSSTSSATVTGGVVNGVSAGTSIISYSLTNMCGAATATKTVTVNPQPDAGTITGASSICPATTTTLSNAVSGGTWASSSSSATVAGGVVTGATTGTSIISYSVTNMCGTATDTMLLTVNPLPNAGTITGANTVCTTASTTLSNGTSGGTWASSSSSATVVGGIVTGATAGTSIISYSVTNMCGTAADTLMMVVNPQPDAGTITGVPSVCLAATTTLSNAVSGGAWASSSSSATVVGGIVTGAAAGTSVISYSVTNMCGTATDTMLLTVNPLPNAGTITGANTVCATASTTLSNGTGGGTWISSSSSATVVGGIVTGATAGTSIISYSVTNMCGTAVDTLMMTINPQPYAGTITGTPSVCPATITTLNNAVSGGTWASSSSSATVVGGIVTGATAGTSIISYSVTNMCGTATDTMLLTVNPLPYAGTITGVNTVCAGATATLSNATSGGTWSSSSSAATVAGGVVSGASAGTAIISYSVTNVCGSATDTLVMTINPMPVAGALSAATAHLCAGAAEAVIVSIAGGSWSSSNPAVSLTDTGVIANSPGSSLISYSVTNMCGTATDTITITVDALPDAGSLSGNATVCAGATTTLTASATGGTWGATNGMLTVGTTGNITGVSAGADTVLYTVSGTCGADTAMHVITVQTSPSAASLTGADSICEGASLSLTASVSGGAWSSSDATILSVTSGGIVTANSTGLVTVSYALTNSCGTVTSTHSMYVKAAADCNNGVAGTITHEQQVSIYPNPSSGTFTVQIPGAVNNASITVTDVSGKVLQVAYPQAGQHQTQVTLSNLASGTYMIQVEADGVQYRDKLVLW